VKRSTIDLINRLGRIQVRPFLAPVPEAGSVIVTTLQEGVQFRYTVVREPGWWVLHCDQVAVRRVEAPTSMFDVVRFLDALPRFMVIAVHRLRADTWMVVPWNASDAAQRGWANGEPGAMHLVRDSIRPFDVVVSRRLGRTILYDTLDEGLGTATLGEAFRESFDAGSGEDDSPGGTPEMRRAYSLLGDYVYGLKLAEEQRSEAQRRSLLEGRLRWHLAFMGADLLGYHEAGEGYEVRWRHNGHEYRASLRHDLQVASAGICLDGTDQNHNLSSIVAVMEEARRRGRPGTEGW
jgi:hypothetical protein